MKKKEFNMATQRVNHSESKVNPLTVKALQPALGAIVGLRLESFIIPVRVADIKSAWGRARFLVEPLYGTGEQWVEIERLTRWEQSETPSAQQGRVAQ
jgi:hypothetical protein